MPIKRKPKKWNPGRPTIKGLQDRIKQLEQQVAHEQENNNYHVTQRKHVEDRLKLVAAENDALNRDKQWLKQLAAEQSSAIAGYMRSR